MIRKLFATALALLFSANAAHAAITIYTDRATFLAALPKASIDTFDDLPLDVPGSNVQLTPSPVVRSNGTYAYTASSDPSGFFVIGSSTDKLLSTNSNNDTITLYNFQGGIQAIGGYFFNTDADGAFTTDGTLTLSLTDQFETLVATLAPAEQTEFVGFISTGTIDELSLTSVATPDPSGFGPFLYPTMNDVVVAAVPEPQTWATLIFGFMVVGLGLRRYRQRVLGPVSA